MQKLKFAIRQFLRDQRGTEALEWGLICGLIVVGTIVAITKLGPKVTQMWVNVDEKIN